jgi:hypothetical protein
MKRVVLFFICLAALTFIALPNLYALSPPGDMQIDRLQREGHGSYEVPYSHMIHSGFECTKCHHMDSGTDVTKCSEAGCHDDFSMGEGLNYYNSFWRAMHVAEGTQASCISCHEEMLGSDRFTGCYESVCHDNLYFSDSWFYNR